MVPLYKDSTANQPVIDNWRKYMKKLQWLCVALVTVCGITLWSSVWAAGERNGEVNEAYAAWDAAFQKGDAKAIAAMYADDALFLPANHEVVRGPSGVEAFFAGLFKMGVTGHKPELIEAGGDEKVVYGSAKWSATGKDKAGKDEPWAGVTSHVFEKGADGKLKIKVHIFN
jgi:ketosteroid isomerase-like protein